MVIPVFSTLLAISSASPVQQVVDDGGNAPLCILKQSVTVQGAGCCEPDECDYRMTWTTRWCEGYCPDPDKVCCPWQSEWLPYATYVDCNGTCPQSCEVVEEITYYGEVIVSCACWCAPTGG